MMEEKMEEQSIVVEGVVISGNIIEDLEKLEIAIQCIQDRIEWEIETLMIQWSKERQEIFRKITGWSLSEFGFCAVPPNRYKRIREDANRDDVNRTTDERWVYHAIKILFQFNEKIKNLESFLNNL
jgi:hypothetical protein